MHRGALHTCEDVPEVLCVGRVVENFAHEEKEFQELDAAAPVRVHVLYHLLQLLLHHHQHLHFPKSTFYLYW
jgi:hypothetical protein